MRRFMKIASWMFVGLPAIYVGLWIVIVAGYALLLTAAGAAGYIHEKVFGNEADRMTKAQLTIYVDQPLLSEGGTVIVAANPVSDETWAALPEGKNLAKDDIHNLKRGELGPGDKLFGVLASQTTTLVEFVYPKGGTFGFNLVARNSSDIRAPELRTREILVGDGGANHSLTGEPWDYVSTILVLGPQASEQKSNGIGSLITKILESGASSTLYEGVVVRAAEPKNVDFILKKFGGGP